MFQNTLGTTYILLDKGVGASPIQASVLKQSEQPYPGCSLNASHLATPGSD
jgi:hypothetical protein